MFARNAIFLAEDVRFSKICEEWKRELDRNGEGCTVAVRPQRHRQMDLGD
jgi:hypothetical protein